MANEYDGSVQREMVTTRVFDAPRALVIEAWTDQVKKLAVPGNEENLDRLADLVARTVVESRT